MSSGRHSWPKLSSVYIDRWETLYRALDGALTDELGAVGANPPGYLAALPTGLPTTVQWLWVLVLLWLCAVCLLWLFIPRPDRSSRTLRPWGFRVLALLLPGTGLLDGAWGMVLLLGWAAALVGLAPQLGLWHFPYLLDVRFGAAFATLLSVLSASYVINALALFTFEARQWRRAPRRSPETPSRPQGSRTGQGS